MLNEELLLAGFNKRIQILDVGYVFSCTHDYDMEDALVDCLLLVPDKVLKSMRCLTSRPLHGVRFVGCDELTSLEAASTFDHVVHKAGHDNVLRSSDAGAAARCNVLRHVVRRASLIEPLERVACFADRGELCRLLAQVPGVRQPRFLEVRSPGADLASLMREADLRFPVMCKPLVACGTVESHQLAVVRREDGLASQRSPLLLQVCHCVRVCVLSVSVGMV